MQTNTNMPMPGSLAGLGGLLAFGVTFMIVLAIVSYVISAIPFFKLYRKAGRGDAWLAFVPLAQFWPFLGTIEMSYANILWVLAPLLGVIFLVTLQSAVGYALLAVCLIAFLVVLIVWYVKLFNVFGMSPLWLLLWIAYIIPVLNGAAGLAFLIVMYVMAFNDKYTYQRFKVPPGDGMGF